MSSGNKFRCSPCALFHPLKAKKPDAMMESGFLATQSGKTRDACLTRNPRRTRAKIRPKHHPRPITGHSNGTQRSPEQPICNQNEIGSGDSLSTDGSRMVVG